MTLGIDSSATITTVGNDELNNNNNNSNSNNNSSNNNNNNNHVSSTASGTCHLHHNLMVLRQTRLLQNQQQQQQHECHQQQQEENNQYYHHHQHHHHRHQQQQQQQQQHGHQLHHRGIHPPTRVGYTHLKSMGKDLFLFSCILVLMFSQAQARVRIVVQPRSTSVAQGWTVVLNCTVADRGSGQVQWSQDDFGLGDDRAMPAFDRYSMIGVEQGTVGEYNLQIQDVRPEDEADYHCQVSPSEGSEGVMSRKARLSVVVFPRRPYITKAPTVPVVLHRPTDILCHADGGKPAPQITWHVNGQRVTRDVTSRSTPDGKLVNVTSVLTYNASMSDAAKKVECQVISEFMDTPFRTFANLDVQFAPNISMTFNVTSRNIRQGDHVRFQCSGLANPASVVWKWYRDNELIPKVTGNVHHIRNIGPEYNGDVISCEATNTIGSTRVDQKLNVEYGPQITHITKWLGTDIGGKAELNCEVDGNPSPSVIWRRKDRAGFAHRTLSTRNTYRIERVNSQSFGWYVCTATVLGFPESSMEAMVVMNAPPKPRSKKKQEAEEGEKGYVTCEVTSIPLPASIKWLKDGKAVTISLSGRFRTREEVKLFTKTFYLLINKVKSTDFGYYNCSVTNAYGTSMEQVELVAKHTLPITYIIVGIIVGFVVIFIIILVCILYRRYFRKDDIGSVLGSYTDTDSSSEKKREKADSPSTLMGQLRQGYGKDTYRFSADYDDMPYKEHANGNNNGYRYIEPSDTYSDSNIYDGDYIRSDLGHNDRIVPLYTPTPGYNLSSFRSNNFDQSTPPPTMSRLTPLHMSNSKLATDV